MMSCCLALSSVSWRLWVLAAYQTNRLERLSSYIYSTDLDVSSQHGNTRLQEHSRDYNSLKHRRD